MTQHHHSDDQALLMLEWNTCFDEHSIAMFVQTHFPDDYEIVGPDELRHILSGGRYDHSRGSLRLNLIDALSVVASTVTLLQASYAAIVYTARWRRGADATPTADDAIHLRTTRDGFDRIRDTAVRAVRSRHNLDASRHPETTSEDKIEAALRTIENRLP